MSNMLEHKGYLGQFSYDDGDDALHGTVLNLRDVIHFQGRSIDELRQSFRDSVDDYLAWCVEEGKVPDKPYSGKFIVRMDPALHRRASMQAQHMGKSLNQWVSDSLEKVLA